MKKRALTPEVLTAYRKQHRTLFRAVMDRDAAGAREAAHAHLLSVREGLGGRQ